MALIKYGGGIVQMSGSIAGNTHARNRFGNYMRARTKPVNPRSSRQMGARVLVMMLAEQWRELPMTDAKRLAWQVYANSVNWHNKLGEIIKLTGFNMFIRSNAARMRVGGALITDGPVDLGLPPGDPTFLVENLSAATQQYDTVFDDTFDWCDEDGGFLTWEFGEPQNATRNFFGAPWRYEALAIGSTVAPPASPLIGSTATAWTLTEGQKIWVRGQIIRMDGRVSTKFEPAAVIVGA